jgi:aminodeoxyfutalosine deaminase
MNMQSLPKVELHVHLEGSIRPETLLKLAARHGQALPSDTVEGLQQWYRFQDFPHFVEVYVAISKCIQTAEDVELVAWEFLEGQARQNVLHTEATYTASTIEKYAGIPWAVQLAALGRAKARAESELGITVGWVLDIVRGDSAERGVEVAKWATAGREFGVVALGLSGEEKLAGAEAYADALQLAEKEGLAFVPHAGETVGPESIWNCLRHGNPVRIGHGVRAVEDPALMRELASRQITLEVCPTSNIALGVYPSLEAHPLPVLLDEGIPCTINSDDPPMFGTTITDELERCASAFEFDEHILWSLTMNAARSAILANEAKSNLITRLRTGFAENGTTD